MNKLNVLFMSAIIVSTCMFASCNKDDQQEKTTSIANSSTTKAIPVKVQKVTQTTSTAAGLQYSGTVEAKNKVQLSFQVAGKLQNIGVEVGDKVNKGQKLAALEKTDYQSQVEINQANVTLAEDAFNRIEQLYQKQSIPESKYIEAKAKLQQAKAQYNIVKKQLADTDLKASFSGTIAKKKVEEGMMVSPSVPAFEVVNLQKVYIVVAVPESEIGAIKVGDKAQISVAAMNLNKQEGSVAIISPIADSKSRTFEVKVEIDNQADLRQGMLSEVTFYNTVQKQDLVVIEGSALLNSPSMGAHVFVADKSGKVKATPVKIGAFMGEKVTIVEGLKGGEQIVVAGHHKLEDGSLVKI